MGRSLIFLHFWRTTCQSISLAHNPYRDTRINASNVFKSKRDRNALFTIFCLENLLSNIAVLDDMTSIFCHNLMRFGQFVFHSKVQPHSDYASWIDFWGYSCRIVSTNSNIFNLHASRLFQKVQTSPSTFPTIHLLLWSYLLHMHGSTLNWIAWLHQILADPKIIYSTY